VGLKVFLYEPPGYACVCSLLAAYNAPTVGFLGGLPQYLAVKVAASTRIFPPANHILGRHQKRLIIDRSVKGNVNVIGKVCVEYIYRLVEGLPPLCMTSLTGPHVREQG